jgi:hypothetical protein
VKIFSFFVRTVSSSSAQRASSASRQWPTWADGVAIDLDKVLAIELCPSPCTLHTLHRFLDLMGYCMKFIVDYGTVACPLWRCSNMMHSTGLWMLVVRFATSSRCSCWRPFCNCRISTIASLWSVTSHASALVSSCVKATGL